MGKASGIHLAAKDGDTSKLKKALSGGLFKKKKDIDLPDDHSWTPLHYAAVGGHSEAVEMLLKHSADVHVVNMDGETPLFLAAKKGHKETCKVLLDHGSKILTANNDGWTPRVVAEKMDHTDVARYLKNEEQFADQD